MTRRLVFTPEAAADIRAGHRWYEAQQPGLGEAFKQAVRLATTQATRSPDRFRVAFDPFRRVLVRRFPFEVLYTFDDALVVVHLVFHTSQDPSKWRERLRVS